MKVVIEMPIQHYDRFLQKCDESACPEFAILKRGTFNRRVDGDRFLRTMQIHCETAQAKRLLKLATELCPEAVAEIQKALNFPGGS